MGVTSLSAERVKRSNNPCDWTLRDMLIEMLRRLDDGEVRNDLPAIVVYRTTTDENVHTHTLVSGVDCTSEAVSLMAQGIRTL